MKLKCGIGPKWIYYNKINIKRCRPRPVNTSKSSANICGKESKWNAM